MLLSGLVARVAVAANVPPPGFLCCNLHTDGTWASDSNYRDSNKKLLPAGTRVVPIDFGRNRINVEMDGIRQSIGNDYSRDLSPEQFAARWIVRANPRGRLAKWSDEIRSAVRQSKVMRGMTRAQVQMSLGYPTTSYTPNLNLSTWRYRTSSRGEFQVLFGAMGWSNRSRLPIRKSRRWSRARRWFRKGRYCWGPLKTSPDRVLSDANFGMV